MARQHTTGSICVDCLMLTANGEMPPDLTESQCHNYVRAIESHPNYGAEMTLGHLHDSPDAQCWHAGEECGDDCECERTTFSSRECDVCGSDLAGERHDVTFWWDE